jgi:protein O-GlcNAc transferase
VLLAQAVRLQRDGKLAKAVVCYEQALSLNPNIPEALSNLAIALKALGKVDAAITRLEQALALRPNTPEILVNLGILLREQGRSEDAAACYRKALALKPNDPVTLSNLGNALKDQGRFDEGIACYRQARALRPNHQATLRNLSNAIFDMHYSEQYGNRSTLDAARLYARHVEPARQRTDFANRVDPERRLRIGYVSPDFYNHGVSYFFHGAVEAHDPAQVEVYCYSNSHVDDEMTARIRNAAHGWRIIAGLSDAAVDAIIRRDEIDILVNLAGYTAESRLALFALKPAPVQALWQGYLDTTGLTAMDYFITDRWVVPAEDEGSFSETVLRLPDAHFCFAPTGLDIPIRARPSSGPLTFGSFNNFLKVSDGTVALWSRIIREIAGSRLLLKGGRFGNPAIRRLATERFAAHGIGADRLMLQTVASRTELLAAYNDVDIGLDPFPYNGCTTTIEALWMGVPVVALRGNRSVARASEAILSVVGLPNLVAEDGDAYVAVVKALADDRRYLSELKGSLRTLTEQSPICDCRRFAQGLEKLYRQIWTTWCTQRREQPRSGALSST